MPHNSVIVLEGAQGMLLDVTYGFWPYVTKTEAGPSMFAPFAGIAPKHRLVHIGVLRAYATRHGAGPLVTEDAALAESLPEAHNARGPWQGPFRVGHFDLVASRYAIQAAGTVDMLCLTHLDRLAGRKEVRVCIGYELADAPADAADYFEGVRHRGGLSIHAIRCPRDPSRERQERLGQLLLRCSPSEFCTFEGWSQFPSVDRITGLPGAARRFISFVETKLGRPVGIVSTGPEARFCCGRGYELL